MTQSEFIAVIDLGTYKIKGVVGRKNDNNVFSILESKTIDSGNSIRRGMVYNIEETGASVRKLITMLENSTGQKIGKVYVSLTGQSLHTMELRETKQLSSGGIVSDDVIKQLRASADKFTPDLKRNYAVADVEYFIDGKHELKPVGVAGSKIEAAFQIVTGRPNLLSNIEKSISDKAKLPIAGYVVGALASAAVALNDEEKELGCAFVDFGAGTTTLSVYKNGTLKRMVVIPFGGKNITKDICALNITENDAEELKIKFGKAHENHESPFFTSPFSSKPDVDLTELNRVIGLRLDEISANLMEQIRLTGLESELGAGMIITGGASQLKNMSDYLTLKFKMPVRKATAKKVHINNAPELLNDPSFTQVLGMLLFGEESCHFEEVSDDSDYDDYETTSDTQTREAKERVRAAKKIKKTQKQGFLSKFGDMFENMFSEEDE
ncbi:MAG: cell division protein FtsA [Fermentimonas sp.]|jgi:cell division protein FtsA|nr:cell division protein FtsA [Fermentimonas sp.]MDD3188114.1 cell division protein FtsA [Fermentimonas sp.]MDD3510462.1 cell division protein FtsA [Fermentimonas sp.]MDD4284824.1 cell division protein FtsA [Fermentimonas sp.]MDD4723635.1 cell division protein FtsA [Fermentimonas sp.]